MIFKKLFNNFGAQHLIQFGNHPWQQPQNHQNAVECKIYFNLIIPAHHFSPVTKPIMKN